MNPCMVIVTDRQLMPLVSGNRLRILGLMRAFRELGWKVGLVAVRGTAAPQELRPLVDELLLIRAQPFRGGDLDGFDPRPFRHALRHLVAKLHPAVVIAEYTWLGSTLSGLPHGVERWLDCHDLLHERTERFGAAGLNPWVTCTWEQEARRLAIAETILATQEREAALLRHLLPEKRIAAILTPIDLPVGFSRAPGSGTIVLTVGANHPGNAAVLDFAREVWPRVLARVPEARLHVVGGISVDLPALPGVYAFGQVANLQPHYTAAAVVVCPIAVGTGVKTKMLEALRYGKAVVVTPEAEEGMPAPERCAWVTAPSLAACADAVVDLLANAPARAALEAAAFAYGERHVAAEAFREQIRRLLHNDLAQRPVSFDADRATMSSTRSVSVIVRHVGSGTTLRACLDALLRQSDPGASVEIIVVVHADFDAVRTSVRVQCPAVTVLYEVKPGASAACNRGADNAKGELIVFLDSDCRPARNWLANALAAADREADPCIVASTIKPGMRRRGAGSVRWYDAVLFQSRRHEIAPGVPAAAMCIPRELWQRRGRFEEGPPVGADAWLVHGAGIVSAADAVVLRPVLHSWRGLRSEAYALARRELARAAGPDRRVPIRTAFRADCRRRLRHELIVSLRHPGLPWRFRPGVAVAAALVWYWSRRVERLSLAAPPASAANFPPLARDSVSVIVPCRGWPETLAACLRSAQSQVVGVSVEIIVVVNGAEPPTQEHAWPGVTIVHEPAPGPAAARNAGVRVASGDVLAFIDADCVASPSWLAAALATMGDGASDCVVAGAIVRSGARRSWVSLYDSVTYLRQEDYVKSANACVTANLLVHRMVFERIGQFDQGFDEAAFEDWEWSLRARRAGVPIIYAAGAVVDHPCMTQMGEVRRKAERLARGELQMQQKLGQVVAPPRLIHCLNIQLRRAYGNRRLRLADRLRVMCVGVAVGFWSWKAFRQRHRSDLKRA